MSSFLCFICHSTVNMDTNEETREKYKELVGMHLNQDSHLCHICCHVLKKFWLFRSVCLKRSMEYPVLFSEKGTIYLHINDIELFNLCPNDKCQNGQRKSYHNPSYYFNNTNYCNEINDDQNDNMHKNDLTNYFRDNIDNTDTANSFDSQTATHNVVKESHYEIYKQNSNTKTFVCVDDYFENEPVNDGQEEKISNDYSKESNANYKGCNGNELNNIVNDDRCNGIESCNDAVKNDYTIDPDNSIDSNSDNIDSNTINNTNYIDASAPITDARTNNVQNANDDKEKRTKKKKCKKSKSDFEKIVLSLEEQKAELERCRREEKYIEAEFKCYNCAQSFLFKDTYQTHMMRHEESNGEYRCTTCTLRFVTPAVFRAHTSLHTDRYKCLRCGLMLRPRQCKAHAIQCGGESIQETVTCHLCGNVFKKENKRAYDLSNFKWQSSHMGVCNNKIRCQPWKGSRSGKKWEMMWKGMKERISRKRRGKIRREREVGLRISDSPHETRDSNGLSQHLNRFHKLRSKNRTYSCTVCGRTYNNQAAVRTHMIKHIQRRFPCEQCQSVFSSPYMLKQHMKKHDATLQEQHYCTTCKIGYDTRKSLLAHKRNALVHQRTVFECKICSRLCPNRLALAAHMQRVHAPCKQYACNVCGKRYSSVPSLRRHEATHMPAKEVKFHMCHMCPRTFKSRSKLNRHLREVCEKDKLEEELSIYYAQTQPIQ